MERKPRCANDYEAFFELIHGFNASLPWINNYGIDITKQPSIEIDTDFKDAKYTAQ